MKKTGCRAFMLIVICLLFWNNIYALDLNDFKSEAKTKFVTSDRLKLTIIIDESGKDLQYDIGYKLHAEAHYLLSDSWGNGTTGIGGSGYCYETQYGSLQDMDNGDVLQFRFDSFKGNGTGWNHPEQETNTMVLQNGTTWVHTYQDRTGTYTDSSPQDPHQVSAYIERTASGAVLYFANLCIGNGNMQYPFLIEDEVENREDFFSFKITNAELQGDIPIRKNFTRTFKGITNPCEITYSAQMVLEEEKLKADFTVSGLERGLITLDGSASKGKIKEYSWSFAKAGAEYPEGIQFDPGVKLSDKIVQVVLLEPVEVTLKVTDSKGRTKEKKQLVAIQPRNFLTQFKQTEGKRFKVEVPLVSGSFKHLKLGRTVCGECYKDDNSYDPHYLHPKGQSGANGLDWETPGGYSIEKVSGGPFKGTFYVKDYKMKLHRRILINEHLGADDPGGAHCHYLNPDGMSFITYNKKQKGSEWAAFIASIKAHEQIHADLAKEPLLQGDPAAAIEAKFATDHTGLTKEVNLLISQLDLLCNEKDQETTVRERLRNIYKDKHYFRAGFLTIDYDAGGNPSSGEYQMYDIDIFDFDDNP
jgi:hypothetical protein